MPTVILNSKSWSFGCCPKSTSILTTPPSSTSVGRGVSTTFCTPSSLSNAILKKKKWSKELLNQLWLIFEIFLNLLSLPQLKCNWLVTPFSLLSIMKKKKKEKPLSIANRERKVPLTDNIESRSWNGVFFCQEMDEFYFFTYIKCGLSLHQH